MRARAARLPGSIRIHGPPRDGVGGGSERSWARRSAGAREQGRGPAARPEDVPPAQERRPADTPSPGQSASDSDPARNLYCGLPVERRADRIAFVRLPRARGSRAHAAPSGQRSPDKAARTKQPDTGSRTKQARLSSHASEGRRGLRAQEEGGRVRQSCGPRPAPVAEGDPGRPRRGDEGGRGLRCVSRRLDVLRRLHAIDATRLHERRRWVVSFPISSCFGPI